MDIKKLSAAKLEALQETRNKAFMACVDALIDAGRGQETMAETREAAKRGNDPLAIAYCNALTAECDTRHEMDRRKRYHGTLKPIKHAA